MFQQAALAALSLGAGVYAQQIGTLTTETHPKLTIQKCSGTGGTSCTTEQHTVVLDANWRWLHTTSGSTNCYSGSSWDATLCPDGVTCAQNCALDGADYTGTYGVKASGNSLSLTLVTVDQYGTNSGSRLYLMDTSDSKYMEWNLLNQEFTFDVDVSKLPCGLNGALYFSSMDADGGASKYPNNKAGAKYGTGYCDSQCPHDIKFIEGAANVDGWNSTGANTGQGKLGACCSEMDIWEANSISSAYTPHPCNPIGLAPCDDDASCASGATCDKAGCDFNAYRMGNTTFYGPGSGFTLDTTQKMTVVTQFLTDDGTSTGTLTEIKRFYVQNGVTYANANSDIAGVSGNSLTQSSCDAAKTAFGDTNTFDMTGGMAGMGQAFAEGMVLVLSIWDDNSVDMLWLDSDYPTTADPSAPGVARGTCSTDSGKPADVEKNSPGATVVFSNIKYGPIGSTFQQPAGGNSPPPSSSSTSKAPSSSTTTKAPSSSTTTSKPVTTTTTKKTTTTTTTTTSKPAANCAAKWGQCGGQGWNGATCCASGSTCKVSNPYYSQCL